MTKFATTPGIELNREIGPADATVAATGARVLRVISWNMGMSMDAYAEQHDRAWHFLVSLNPDVALVQEAIPPAWIGDRFTVHHEPFQLWTSAVVVRPDWPSERLPFDRASVLGSFGSYLATTHVEIPVLGRVVVASVHTTAKPSFGRQLIGLDIETIRRPSVPEVWMNDLAVFGYGREFAGQSVIIGGDWNTSRRFDEEVGWFGGEFYAKAESQGWVETQWRQHGEETQTWLRRGNRPHQLDHVFCDEQLATRLVGSRSFPEPVSFLDLSDHAPLVVDFQLDPDVQSDASATDAEVHA